MIEEKISQERILELGEDIDITKTKKRWEQRSSFSDSTTVNSRKKVKSEDVKSQSYIDLGFLSPFFQLIKYTLIALLILVIAYIIIQVFKNIEDVGDKKVALEELLEAEEEDIREMDLEGMLTGALLSSNYKLAIRVRFLMLLKQLTEKSQIDWSIEKTNRDYLRELRKHPDSSMFREIFLLYEVAWYSDDLSGETDYNHFNTLLSNINLSRLLVTNE